VDGDAESLRLKRSDGGDAVARGVHHDAFSDLELEESRRQVDGAESVLDHRLQLAALELATRQIDRDPKVMTLVLPLFGLGARRADDPLPDGNDQSGFLGQRNEPFRQDDSPLRVLPAKECLRPDDPPGALDERLEVEHELLLVEGPMELVLQREPLDRTRVHREAVEPWVTASLP